MMVKEFNTQMNKENIPEEAEKQKMSIRDLVNMAALVEMEAVFKEEQPRIAGVFLRRLEIYMPIQSDTTIQYILGTQKKKLQLQIPGSKTLITLIKIQVCRRDRFPVLG